MKRILLILSLLLAASLVLAACGQPTVEPVVEEVEEAEVEEAEEEMGLPDLEGQEVTIAVENAYLPFNYIDPETGEPAGWDYEVWDAICEAINCTPKYVEAAWEGMIQAVADGQFDAAADGITITEERDEIVDFSIGYVAIEQRLLVRVDEDRIESIEDIVADEDLKLGTQTGTTNYETASQYLDEERIAAFEQFPFAVQAVIAGDIDAVIIDEVAGQGYLGENADALKLVGPSLSSDHLGFIFPSGSELVEPVNAGLEELMKNGFLAEVNAKYFGPDFDITYDDLFPPEEEEMGLPDLDGQEVTIAIENAYLPFNYIDPETGEPAGWDYEVWDELCVVINCTPVYVEAAWEGMIQAVADGQFDAAADGITITEERDEIVDFSIGYVAIEQRLLVRVDEDRIESIEDIVADEELKLGTQTGTTNYETASQYLDEERIAAFEQFPFAVQAVIAGDIDAVIIDEVAGQGYLGENADALKLVGPSLSSDHLGFIFPNGSELVEPVNAGLEELMKNGFLQEVNVKYFGPDFDITYDDLFPPEEEEAEAMDPAEFLACQVTDVGGIDDKSFNATAWKGMEDAMAELGIEAKYLESQQQTDYEVNINAFVEEGCDLIMAVGFLLGDATAAAAEANPDQKFGIVDVNWLEADNLYGSGFAINEATFLAGYLAAGMTETGTVATFGGINIPPVAVFMDGFVLGVEAYNAAHGTEVQTLGWDYEAQDGLFVGNFESTDDGRTMGESLMDEGADIIMPVAGPVGAGTLAVMEERGAGWIIGVDNDWSVSFEAQAEYVLASALKNMDLYVFETVKAALDGSFAGGNYLGTLENGGVGLGYGGVEVPEELKAEIEALIPQIVAGDIATLP